jgi:G:T-mismatch repair DNA endonuclease (very short patch repair protein)
MSKKMQMKRFKDIHRYQFLRKRGYKVYVIWECKILNKPDEAREELRGYGNIPIL